MLLRNRLGIKITYLCFPFALKHTNKHTHKHHLQKRQTEMKQRKYQWKQWETANSGRKRQNKVNRKRDGQTVHGDPRHVSLPARLQEKSWITVFCVGSSQLNLSCHVETNMHFNMLIKSCSQSIRWQERSIKFSQVVSDSRPQCKKKWPCISDPILGFHLCITLYSECI